MVYIVNDCRKIISCRSGDDNVLSTSIDMSLCFCFGCVETCALKNNVYTDLAPRKLCCVCFRVDLDLFAINCDGIFTVRYGICKSVSALCGVIF